MRDHGAIVTAFYLSNVESYLTRNGVWPIFCANVATMPLDEDSSFIRPMGGGANVQMLLNSQPVPVTGTVVVGGSRGSVATISTNGGAYAPTVVMGRGGAGRGGAPLGAMAVEVKTCGGGK